MSAMAGTSSLAAMRGKSDFANDEVAATTCVKGGVFLSNCSKRGETVSANGSEYCGEVEYRIDDRPFSLERVMVSHNKHKRVEIPLGFAHNAWNMLLRSDH
jgi:hypothetical protein